MLQRPKLGETEEDLLKQQEEFLKTSGKQSTHKRKIPENEEKPPKRFEILGDIVEKTHESYIPDIQSKSGQAKGFPKLFAIDPSLAQKSKGKKSLFALQLERSRNSMRDRMDVDSKSIRKEVNVDKRNKRYTEDTMDVDNKSKESVREHMSLDERSMRRTEDKMDVYNSIKSNTEGKISIDGRSIDSTEEKMDIDGTTNAATTSSVNSESLADTHRAIHEENLEKLYRMSEKEILEEKKKKLLETLDPNIVSFLKNRKKGQGSSVEAKKDIEKMEEDGETASSTSSIKSENLVDTHRAIHEENLEKLYKMSEKEILEEKKKLLDTLDPSLVSFLKNRKKEQESSLETNKMEEDDAQQTVHEKQILKEDILEKQKKLLNKLDPKLASYLKNRIKKEKQEIFGDKNIEKMDVTEIQKTRDDEQKKLLESLDPTLRSYLKSSVKEQECSLGKEKTVERMEKDETKRTIHEENLEKLSKMSEKEILEEQKKLLKTLDPNLVSLLKNRKKGQESSLENEESNLVKEEPDEEEVKKNLEKYLDTRWINMDFIEKEKLEWIGDIPDKKSLEPDQPYSARFDFKGELQPFATDIDVTSSLYHHGDEPNRPGYTIQELYQLSRSKILQQRILALNTLANIIRKTKLGYYDRCFDNQLLHKLVESDLFFLLRFSIDDNPLVSASIYCLHNLLCNESDEFCLDKLLGVTYADEQPLIFNQMKTNKDEEKELKDHVLISCDMIKGVLRTDLLVRLAYVLTNFTPNRETIIRGINCLIRISRHSLEAATKVFNTTNLLEIVFSYIKTSAPVFEGVKLFRVMITHSKELATEMIRRFDVKFFVSFIESEENRNISKKEFYLLKLETIYFWRVLLLHDLFTDEFVMWCPCLVRLLLFYTQKVDVNAENDFDFELFSAMTSLIIVCNKRKIQLDSNILPMIRICLEKWLTQLIQLRKYNFAVSKAIGCALRYFTSYFQAFGVSSVDLEFIRKINSILVSFLQSEIFSEMSVALRRHSHILSLSEVTRDPENLPSLCSIYDGGDEFVKIVQNSSCLPFFVSLVKYLKTAYRVSHEAKLVIQLLSNSAEVRKYVRKVCNCHTKTYNWFMKYETGFLTNFLQLLLILEDKDLLTVSFGLLPLLRVDDKNSKKVLKIICSSSSWQNVRFVDSLSSLYSDSLLQERDAILNYQNTLVPEDWLYKVLALLRSSETAEPVLNVLKFICIILKQNPDLISKVPHTFRYYHLCSVFLTDENVFDTEVQNVIAETFSDVVLNRDKVNLNLKFDKNKSFYDSYTELITQYAGVSYGLPIFAQFVLFPLQNRFNVAFRKLIWFEYLHVLRVITLSYPVDGFVCIKDFVEPCEKDESLLVAYINSVCNNVIMKKRNPFVYNIAIGNVKTFLEAKNQDEKLLVFLKRKVEDIKNEELKTDILKFSISN